MPPRFNLKAQVATLGADSLLPPTKVKKLTAKQLAEFEMLVDGVSLPSGRYNNGRRVIARLEMRTFVAKHGRDACDVAFKKLTGKK